MKRSIAWLLAGAALTVSAAAGAALAADQAKPDDRRVERREERREVRVYRHGERDRTVVIRRGEGRAEHLRDVLQLRPEQEGALTAFVEATARGGRDGRMVRLDRDETRSTAERLSEMEARLAEQQASSKRKIEAIRTFYNQLDARQKKAFDAMPMLMMVGPEIGPMLIPAPMRIRHMLPPPAPPAPPVPPRS